jgi:glycosyltransferase involved in cell wall biosynthesis
MRYLLVTHIGFARMNDSVILDGLWGEDLKGLVASVGPITVAAPEVNAEDIQAWGPGVTTLGPEQGLTFLSLPPSPSRLDLTYGFRLRKVLRKAVNNADLVHTSNLFRDSTALYYAHDLAVRLKKKTLFVVAEDFFDMQMWERIRPETRRLRKLRQLMALRGLDRHVRRRVQSSSLTFLHTPAAVNRYRLYATNAVAIRQPVHEAGDVISEPAFALKCSEILANEPLTLCTASRMESLKGIDFIVRAVWILKQRGIPVRARIYGGGKKLDEFKALTEQLSVTDMVEFPGSLSPSEVLYKTLAEGHVFLMPHLTTDFGRAFFDAMASGSPVIAFRSAASVDTVRDGVDGLIVPNADDEGLADGIARLHHDRGLLQRLSCAARERALRNTKSFWNGYRAQMIRDLFQASSSPE